MNNHIDFEDHLKECLKDPEFKREWDKLEPQQRITSALIEARLNNDLSQKELALRANTTQAVISRLENATVNPTIGLLQRVAEAMGKKLEINFV